MYYNFFFLKISYHFKMMIYSIRKTTWNTLLIFVHTHRTRLYFAHCLFPFRITWYNLLIIHNEANNRTKLVQWNKTETTLCPNSTLHYSFSFLWLSLALISNAQINDHYHFSTKEAIFMWASQKHSLACVNSYLLIISNN